MAVMIKTKPKEVVATAPTSEFADKIDRLGKVRARIVALNAAIQAKAKAEHEELSLLLAEEAKLGKEVPKLLEESYADMDADSDYVEAGSEYEAQIGKKGNLRVIRQSVKLAPDGEELPGMLVLRDLMGEDTFFAKAKMNIKDIDDYLTPDEKELVIENTRTKREIKIVRKGS